MCQSIKDKVINHLVSYYFLIDNFDKNLINNNVATRINKGTHFGLSLFKKYYNYYKNKYNDFYILKFDIKKYFYNIDHNIVKELIRNKIKDKKALKLIEKIIDSTDEDYVNKSILILKEKYNIELPIYKKGKGLPIGNMTSQVIACIYLDELDKYIVNNLKIKGYIRYMDDGVLFSKDKEYLKYCLSEIERIVKRYRLELNNKTKKKFKRNINDKNISSYLGHLSYGNCKSLIRSVVGGDNEEKNR